MCVVLSVEGMLLLLWGHPVMWPMRLELLLEETTGLTTLWHQAGPRCLTHPSWATAPKPQQLPHQPVKK